MRRSLFLSCLMFFVWSGVRVAAAAPVQFDFQLEATTPANPFAREIWAEVTLPSGQVRRLPAFYVGDDRFAVRARATEAGDYQLGRISEKSGETETVLTPKTGAGVRQHVDTPVVLAQIGIAADDRTRFAFVGSGGVYTPIGSNVAWAPNGVPPADYFAQVFPQFSAQGLNWIRIWMCHWGGLNLDWRAKEVGPSPPAGWLDLAVAQAWDRVVADAEKSGVYLQMVLQHHGQYATGVNPNWEANPWNAANPDGFLKSPADFFSSPEAREATRIKYRYIAARWGYSPAIMAWELFNEVHWVDAINRQHDETVVAHWHAEMAAHLRAHDPYGHLVTTSLENLRSEIYASMDYRQPHLYPYSVLAGPLTYALPAASLGCPVFYGETGDDHAPLSYEQKQSGVAIVPPVWAGFFGAAPYSAQPWLGDDLIRKNRLGELGAVARFLAATRLAERADLVPFSPRIESFAQVPWVLEAGQVWQRRPAPELDLPLDGRMPVELADIPRAYVGSPKSLADGLPGRATYQLHAPRDLAVRARISGVGKKGSTIRITCDGRPLLEKTWAAGAKEAPAWDRLDELAFTIPAGEHTLVVENPGAEDWFQLDQIATDLPVPALAALGKRSDDFIALWLWHRSGVFALQDTAAADGTLLLDEVPAGQWTVTWWDTFKGSPASTCTLTHAGGVLKLLIPLTTRHTAVVLER